MSDDAESVRGNPEGDQPKELSEQQSEETSGGAFFKGEVVGIEPVYKTAGESKAEEEPRDIGPSREQPQSFIIDGQSSDRGE